MAKDRTYEIDLGALHEGRNEFDYRITKEFFEHKENDDILGADIDVTLDIDKRHGSYRMEFGFEGELQVACDRCLEAVTVPVDTDYETVVRHGEEYAETDDVITIPQSRNRYDVSGLIYDTLLLAVPLRCVHAEGECNAEMQAMLRQHNGDEENPEEQENDSDGDNE